jgi:hypothetical protein
MKNLESFRPLVRIKEEIPIDEVKEGWRLEVRLELGDVRHLLVVIKLLGKVFKLVVG